MIADAITEAIKGKKREGERWRAFTMLFYTSVRNVIILYFVLQGDYIITINLQ